MWSGILANPDPVVDQALAAALPTADPAVQARIVAALIDRGPSDASLAAIAHYHLLSNDLQMVIRSRLDELARALRLALERPDGPAVGNALDILLQTRAYRFAHLLPEVLRRGSPPIRRRAGETLEQLAGAMQQQRQHGEGDSAGLEVLLRALHEALQGYIYHGQPAVLRAYLVLATVALPQVEPVLADPAHPATRDLGILLAQAQEPAARRALLPLCLVPTLREAAETGIRRIDDPAALQDLLPAAHLLTLPAVAQVVGKRLNPGVLLPEDDEIANLPPDLLRLLPLWTAHLPLELDQKVAALARLARQADEGVRFRALEYLIQWAGPPSSEVEGITNIIAALTGDTSPAVALLAMRHLVRLDHPVLARLLPRLVNSPHEAVRHLAEQHLAPQAFARLWAAWPEMPESQRLAAGRAWIKIDAHFARHLSDKLAQPEEAVRLKALAIIALLAQGPLFEPALLELLRDRDVKIVSAAVKALGGVGSAAAVAALEECLKHPDSRVRANAVEALEDTRSTRHMTRLVEMAESDENRPRANAIRALLNVRVNQAVPALARMLADPRPRQRISALWVVQTMGLLDVARSVAELSIADPDHQVRGRAQTTVQQLLDLLHSAHRAPAAAGVAG